MIDDLLCQLELLQTSRCLVPHREVIACAYSTLGHNKGNHPETAFEYIQSHLKILEEASGFSKGEITPVLDALDPRPNQSWMKLGKKVAHRFYVAKAKFLAKYLLSLHYTGPDYTA